MHGEAHWRKARSYFVRPLGFAGYIAGALIFLFFVAPNENQQTLAQENQTPVVNIVHQPAPAKILADYIVSTK